MRSPSVKSLPRRRRRWLQVGPDGVFGHLGHRPAGRASLGELPGERQCAQTAGLASDVSHRLKSAARTRSAGSHLRPCAAVPRPQLPEHRLTRWAAAGPPFRSVERPASQAREPGSQLQAPGHVGHHPPLQARGDRGRLVLVPEPAPSPRPASVPGAGWPSERAGPARAECTA